MTAPRSDNTEILFAKEALGDFKKWRIYKDDIPKNILNPGDPDYTLYKCRTNFFSIIHANIEELLYREVITSDDTIVSYKHYIFKERNWQARTTVNDIVMVNTVIDHIIRKLEALLGDQIGDGDSDGPSPSSIVNYTKPTE